MARTYVPNICIYERIYVEYVSILKYDEHHIVRTKHEKLRNNMSRKVNQLWNKVYGSPHKKTLTRPHANEIQFVFICTHDIFALIGWLVLPANEHFSNRKS